MHLVHKTGPRFTHDLFPGIGLGMEEVAQMRKPEIGEHVIYVDPHQVRRHALVTNVFSAWRSTPEREEQYSINLLFIVGDETRTDSCGRQSQHSTSTPHRVHQMAPGNYWIFADEAA